MKGIEINGILYRESHKISFVILANKINAHNNVCKGPTNEKFKYLVPGYKDSRMEGVRKARIENGNKCYLSLRAPLKLENKMAGLCISYELKKIPKANKQRTSKLTERKKQD